MRTSDPVWMGSSPRRLSGALRYCAALLAAVLVTSSVDAQVGESDRATPPRNIAPGVMITIPPEVEPEETVSTHDVVEIRADAGLQWEPQFLSTTRTLYGMSSDVKFRRDVWGLEFTFKPVRMIEVDVPQANGQTVRERVWYMMYRVTNRGANLTPVEQEDGVVTLESAMGKPVRFVPQFVLEAHDRDASGRRVYKAYLDRVIPAAVDAIRRREMPGRTLLNSAEMAELLLPVSDGRTNQGVWGVATWRDVDPRIDFFSVYVTGLTNAYRWIDPPGVYQVNEPPGKGRRFARKTLQINFWRPGDELYEHEAEIRYGVPLGMSELYEVDEGVAYRWVYR